MVEPDRILEVLRRCEGVVVDPIPQRKITNARASCRVPPHEVVLGLIDRTLFGSAKHAVVFTERAIHVHDRWTTAYPGGVAVLGYTELARLEHHPMFTGAGRTTHGAITAVRAMVEEATRQALVVAPVTPASTPMHLAVAAPAPDDIITGPESVALQAAIAAAPDDDGPQLVLADLLVGADDPRGELIVLHHRELAGGLHDADALDRYLLLAAVYSFPRAEPEEPPVRFEWVSVDPLRYDAIHDGQRYQVRYVDRTLELRVQDRVALRRRLRLARHTWTVDEARLILHHLGVAIRAGTPLSPLSLPFVSHPLPAYDGGPVRSYRLPAEFTQPLGLRPNELGLAARDYKRWIELWRRLARLRAAAA